MMASVSPTSSIPTDSNSMPTMHPNVLWAQRPDVVFVTIEVHDCENPKVSFTDKQVIFEATAQGIATGSDSKLYRAQLDLFAAIDPEKSEYHVAPRNVTMTLVKVDDKAPYWPRLLADKRKPMWLKVDFARWKDEDEDDEVSAMPGMPGMMGGMPGMMGGMGGMGGMPNFDMSSLANMGGMGDMDDSMAGMMDDSDDDDVQPKEEDVDQAMQEQLQ